jgi:hypothetical protein
MAIVTNLQPPAGTPVAVDGPITFDVIDPAIAELQIFVWAVFTDGTPTELVYDANNVQANYSFSQISTIPGGRRFSVRRVGGWPSTPELRVSDSAPASGEANTASNLPGGVGLFQTKAGVDLVFRSFESSDGSVGISGGANTIDLSSTATVALDAVLTEGNNSGANDIEMETAQFIKGVDTAVGATDGGDLNLRAGDNTSAATGGGSGGDLVLSAGDADGTSGGSTGGNVTITAGTQTSSSGGGAGLVSILGAQPAGGTKTGGGILIQAGDGAAGFNSPGGSITIRTGDGQTAAANAGDLNLECGDQAPSGTGAGGDVNIKAANNPDDGTANRGGDVNITSGTSKGTSGDVIIKSGDNLDTLNTNNFIGDVTLQTGRASGGATGWVGGNIFVVCDGDLTSGVSNITGGSIAISAGHTGAANVDGGNITLTGGDNNGGNGRIGGSINLVGGDLISNPNAFSTAGDINITPGDAGASSGVDGRVYIHGSGTLAMLERAAVLPTYTTGPSAGYGRLWVKNDTPNALMFTDDTNVDYQLTPVAGGDTDAIHDNVAGEISAITAKATPTSADFLLIEDAAAANAKKRITIGDLPSGAAAAPLPGTWSEGILFHIDPNNANSWVPNQTTTWTDVVGGLVGTASNVTIVDGYPDFNATTSVVDFGACPSAIATTFVGKGVVSVWVSVNSDGELNTGTIIDAGNDTENWSIRTTNESAGQCKITFEHKFTTTPGIWTTTATVTKTGLWHHILITYDADSVANNPTASLNGEALPTMVEDSTPVGTADTGTAQNLTVGNDAATTQTFDGLIGPITIWGGTGPSSVEAITAQFDRRASEFSYRQPFTLSNDTLWAAQGDLVYGIGNDSSTILGIGTTGQILTVSGGAAPSWADAPLGTPQPGTISEGLAFHVDYNNAASWAPNQATTWTDLIGGLVGTAANIFQSKGHLGFATASNSVVNFGVVTATMADLFAGGGAVEVCLRITSDGELNEGRIIDAGDGGQNWSLYVSGESAGFVKLTFFHDFDTTGGVWSSTLKIPISEFVVLTIKYDSDSTANDPSAWMDGLTLGAMTEDTTPVGTAQTTTTGVDLAIGNDESLAHTFDGSIETVSAWNQTINDEEISDNANVRRARLGLTVTNTAGDLEYATSWSGRDRLAIGTAGQVLTVNSGATAPEWANFFPPVMFWAEEMDSPTTADAKVNANAPLTADADNNELKVRAADDTTEEGALFKLRIPDGATSMDITVTGRAATGESGAKVVKLELYERGFVGAVDTWSATSALDDFDIPSLSEAYIETTTSKTLATWGLTAGKQYQFQWTREATGDTLTGDFWLLSIFVEFS